MNPDVMPPTACMVVGVFIVLFVIAFALKKRLSNLTDLQGHGSCRRAVAAHLWCCQREADRILVASLDRPMSREGRVES